MYQAVRSNTYWSSTDGRARHYPARRTAKRNVAILSHPRTTASEIALLGFIVAVLQVADGVLTGVGMAHFGLHMEGNIILRTLMHHLGYVPALLLVKTIAVGVVASLCIHGWRVRWLKHALRGIIALYLFVAVIPWVVLLTLDLMA
jgi:hypothetical protein